MPTITPTALGETIVAGNDYAFTITLTKDGSTYNVTSATVTCSIKEEGGSSDLIADHAVTLTTPASGIVTLTLLDTETILLAQPDATDSLRSITHLADIKVVESGGAIVHCGPFSFPVRRAIT